MPSMCLKFTDKDSYAKYRLCTRVRSLGFKEVLLLRATSIAVSLGLPGLSWAASLPPSGASLILAVPTDQVASSKKSGNPAPH